MHNFPHINDTDFPNAGNINVYQYENTYDYSRFDNIQMRIKMCSVPWDLGSVRVGLKSIPMGNVVGWESVAERDRYLDSLDGVTFETNYRQYHSKDEIKIPIPFEVALNYNYLIIDYSIAPNSETPVDYETPAGIKRWLYFVRDIDSESVNSTICTIARDSWSMFINDFSVSHMVLERGHAPMFAAANVNDYLSNPIDKNAYLLADDVDFGEPKLVTEAGRITWCKGSMYCIIISSASMKGDWGSNSGDEWTTNVPSIRDRTTNGAPNFFAMAFDISHFSAFMDWIQDVSPQAAQTIQAILFMDSDFLSFYNEDNVFTIDGFEDGGSAVKCHDVAGKTQSITLCDNYTTDMWGFDEKYKNITKLYTSPYSHFEINDDKGNVTVVNIEDCSGKLTARTSLSLAFPFINMSVNVNGIGANSTKSITFKNVKDHNFTYGGRWYDTLYNWGIPCYNVVLSNAADNRTREHYTRETAYDNAKRSAGAAQTVAKADALNAQTNAKKQNKAASDTATTSAGVLTDNASATKKYNKASTDFSNEKATKDQELVNAMNSAMQAWNAGLSRDLQDIHADEAQKTAGIAAAAGVCSGLASVASGDIVGAVSGAVSGVANLAQTAISIDAGATATNATIENSQSTTDAQNTNNLDRLAVQTQAASGLAEKSGELAVTHATNESAAAIANAKTIKTTADAVADNDKTTADANADTVHDAAIDNASASKKESVDTARVQAPQIYGTAINGETGTTRPQGLWLNVVTESKDAIAQAGAQMLRYGYMYNGEWTWTTWNLGERFTYWKASDIWASSQTLPDAFADEIRNYLLEGVTVWRKPEYINHTSIYQNGV